MIVVFEDIIEVKKSKLFYIKCNVRFTQPVCPNFEPREGGEVSVAYGKLCKYFGKLSEDCYKS